MRWTLASVGIAVVLAGACTSILGDDFSIVSGDGGSSAGGAGGPGSGGDGGTSAGGQGGDGGGGSGGQPLVNFECDWDLPEHREIVSMFATPTMTLGTVHAARRGPDSVRVFVDRQSASGGTSMDVYTIDGSTHVGPTSAAIDEIHDVARLSSSHIGVLYETPLTPIELKLRIISDNDPDGSSANDIVVADFSTLPDFPTSATFLRAMMAPVPGGGIDDSAADLVVTYQDTMGDFSVFYARYDNTISPWVRVSDPAVPLTEDDIAPKGMVHAAGVTHALIGQDIPRAMELGPSVTLPVTLRNIGPATEAMGPMEATPFGHVNVLMLDLALGIGFLAGSVDDGAMGAFTSADLTEAAFFTSATRMPVAPFEATLGWFDDVMLMMGPDQDNGRDMAHWMIDNEGIERSVGPLDFTVTLPIEVNRLQIDSVAMALRSDSVDATGATFHVAWVERHQRTPPGTMYDVMYYDRLRCVPR